jgi:hypothetical protein
MEAQGTGGNGEKRVYSITALSTVDPHKPECFHRILALAPLNMAVDLTGNSAILVVTRKQDFLVAACAQ